MHVPLAPCSRAAAARECDLPQTAAREPPGNGSLAAARSLRPAKPLQMSGGAAASTRTPRRHLAYCTAPSRHASAGDSHNSHRFGPSLPHRSFYSLSQHLHVCAHPCGYVSHRAWDLGDLGGPGGLSQRGDAAPLYPRACSGHCGPFPKQAPAARV
ncbi:hypothetical protein SKAU_G00166390 [Synaphobranchus kaupii]|uniref:Uncharacterized protein n=1 Tax=Synaphobranchus kaupii TaxID=118154 RepID=A0A9Q1FJZ6_SYNKA|nr:hypothetical protein SKAU_G00166390 [Synaphobranchus kaupii]